MEPQYNIQLYAADDGKIPIMEWLRGLKDVRGRAAVRNRVGRLELGHFGDCRHIEGSVWELKIALGPGYRVYYARAGKKVVLLLCGGDKRTQAKDIEKAVKYWFIYRSKHNA